MVDENRVRAELRERISTFSDLSREQQDALVESRINEQSGNPRPLSRIRFYQRNIDDPNSQQYLDEPEPPTPPAPPSNQPGCSSFRRIGDLPQQSGSGAAAPIQPNQRPNFHETNITTLPVLNEEEARAKLTQAILDREAVRKQLDHASRRYIDALGRLEQCEFEVASFRGVADKVLQADFENFDKGLDPLQSLPKHLQNVRRDRATAEDRLQRAQALQTRIEQEVHDTQQQLEAADKHVTFASHAVAIALARTLALELDDFEQVAHELRQRIVSLQLPGQNVPDDLIRRAFAPPKPVKGTDEDKAAWNGLIQRLYDDPNADME